MLQLARFVPFAGLVSGFGSIVVVFLQRALQQPATGGPWVALVAAALIALAGVLFLGTFVLERRYPDCWLGQREPDQRAQRVKSFLLSFMIGLLLLIGAAYLAVWQNASHVMEWYRYEFLDKRWLFSLYWIIVLTTLALPPLLYRLLLTEPYEEWHLGSQIASEPPGDERSLRGRVSRSMVFKGLLALIGGFLFFGPPWNIQRTSLEINSHEQVLLGPLQAIDEGYLPNIGPASQQYGPGTQLITYAFMKLSGQFNLVGYRQAQGLLHFVGYAFFVLLLTLRLKPGPAVLAVILSLSLSPFALTGWTDSGGLGVWGWPNPLRYAGAVFLVVALSYWLPGTGASRRNIVAIGAGGVVWGFSCWIAQENLLTGVVAGGLFVLLLWSTRTVTSRRIIRVGLVTGLGFLLAWTPIIAFYLYHGQLQQYLNNYFLVGGQVLRGFSNILLDPVIVANPKLLATFVLAAPLFILMGLAALYGGGLGVSRPLDSSRVRFLALVTVALAGFFGALTRTDAAHLLNTLFAFPLVLALAFQDLPSLGSGKSFARTTANRILLVAILALLPLVFARYGHYVTGRFQRFQETSQATGQLGVAENVAWGRTGFDFLPAGALFHRDPEIEMGELLTVLNGLNRATAGRNVYVHSFPYAEPGLVYFLADLSPPAIYLDPTTMVFAEDVLAEFLGHFESISDSVDYVVAADLEAPEVRLFLKRNPAASVKQVFLSDKPFYLVGSQPTASTY